MRKKYIGIALPEELVKTIDEFIKNNKWGYKNRAELTKDAIRQHIKELQRKTK
ncbi:hypothetical protein HQ533_03665 [Candidatus Woesearchaeota archaeon]|nr:hypothetical protein [Candidatus Woesearchaeota archaeon]